MRMVLVLSFDDKKGAECNKCMVSFSYGEHYHCAGLGRRPICPEDGHRKDCPLVSPNSKLEKTNENNIKTPSPYERTRSAVYAAGNKWAIENFENTH